MMFKPLNFSKGVIDFNDLPLIVFSEFLQEHKSLKMIKKTHICKPLDIIGRPLMRSIMTLFRKNFVPLINQKQKGIKKPRVKKDEM